MPETLAGLLGALHAERERSWAPDQLAVNINQRRELVDAFVPAEAIQVGARLPVFVLEDTDGGEIVSTALAAAAPFVLLLFRFAGCPACNVALPYYDRALRPGLDRLGVPLIAVSPQIPDRLGEIRRRHALGFRVATDRDNRLARALGITFEANAASRTAAIAGGKPLGAITGTGTWELPYPTVLVVDHSLVVRFADITPDWMARTEADAVLDAVEALLREAEVAAA